MLKQTAKNLFYIFLLTISISLAYADNQDEQAELLDNLEYDQIIHSPNLGSGTLAPGETKNVNGFELKWIPTEIDRKESWGKIIISGPKNGYVAYDIQNVYAEFSRSEPYQHYFSNYGFFYIDNVYFYFNFKCKTRVSLGEIRDSEYPEGLLLDFYMHRQSDKLRTSACPMKCPLYVSTLIPVQLDDLHIVLFKEEFENPDGKKQYKFEITDSNSKEKWTLSVVPGGQINIGRYLFKINELHLFHITKTVPLSVDVKEDLSVKGKNAYVKHLDVERYTKYITFFESLSRDYGMQVKWVAFNKNHPESIESAKNFTFKEGYLLSSENMVEKKDKYVEKLLNKLFNKINEEFPENALELQWENPTTLVVRPKNYDILLAKQEEAKKQKALKEEFINQHQLTTKVYEIGLLSPKATAELISQKLKTYNIYHSTTTTPICIIRPEEEAPYTNYNKIKTLKEYAAADEKSGMLFVTALPQTHEAIGETLAKLNAYVENFQRHSIPKSYPIDIILLSGEKLDKKKGDESSQITSDQLREYNISINDLEIFGLNSITELARTKVQLIGERGEIGSLQAALSDNYHCKINFLDTRKPYIMVKGGLYKKDAETPIVENTIFLEEAKPALLGVTNMKEALILIVKIPGQKRMQKND